ncbi:MAG: anhydro-N-acetylmuramic acid kinase [Clostridia bacterium]|nr:anhydro-N-acetylmuramic acid kinase [Clostridia bacterium]
MADNPLHALLQKPSRLVIGLMSGTSADGMDAALVEIAGCGLNTRVTQRGFVSLPYPEDVRGEILRLAEGKSGGSRDLCLFHFLLGQLSLEACLAVCRQAGVDPRAVDLAGSHGQTLYHIPVAESYCGRSVRGTLQLGEASVIAEGLGCPVVSDFRVRDLAAGGQGAPLVPYAEYLLYRQPDKTVGLQNIGGIGNLTVLPRGGAPQDTFAFDTGPGNMVMDQVTSRITGGRLRYDENGALAARGSAHPALLAWLLQDPYLLMSPPKTTGRESYGRAFVDRLMAQAQALGVSDLDTLATATRFTAETIRVAVERFCPAKPDYIVVGGGGSQNPTLMRDMRSILPMPVLVNEDLGFDSEAKEAVAFAVLANECIHGICNNVPSVTGASHPVVMGKISL